MRRKPAHGPKSKTRIKLILLALVFLVSASIYAIWNALPATWDRNSRLVLAVLGGEDNVYVSIFDPMSHVLTKVELPGNTLVSTSHNFGTWKLSSIIKLGEQEKIGPDLAAKTLTKSFKFPIDAWAEEEILTQPFSEHKTNLTFKDKINLGLFSFFVKNADRSNIDIRDTGYLRKSTLPDGEEGYVIAGSVPPNVASYFSDPVFSNEATRITIIDATESVSVSGQLSDIIEVLGGKVFSVQDITPAPSGCTIKGLNQHIVKRLATILSCGSTFENPDSNFDVEIYIGKDFTERF